MSACNTNTGGEDPLITRYKQIGALFYLGTLNQLAYNLDPFDMALDVYKRQGESLPFSGLTVREARRVNARLQNIYQKAVKEAQEITPGKMSDRLWSVDDPWVDRKGDSLVLVVAAIQTKDLPKWTGKAAKQAPASRDEAIWVSLSPELGMVMHNQP